MGPIFKFRPGPPKIKDRAWGYDGSLSQAPLMAAPPYGLYRFPLTRQSLDNVHWGCARSWSVARARGGAVLMM
jgi:hypothetical protein